ncbi:hypothetical protein L1049_015034 [Liquidambar formosana]|uniref:Uncharacterized protein n=1 Tax=Liquidambar formosana TaxID=63359 RepID=A0AAP0RY62_LIQFO
MKGPPSFCLIVLLLQIGPFLATPYGYLPRNSIERRVLTSFCEWDYAMDCT